VTGRDRKILLAVIPVVFLAGYWFLIFHPMRKEASAASVKQAHAEQRRDQAVAKLNELRAAKARFSTDYRAAVRLTRAVPTTLDMAGLIVQLDRAAQGTGIEFDKIAAGDGSESAKSGSAATSQPPAQPAGNAAAGGAKAQTGPGRAAETAGNTVNDANGKSAAADQGSGGADRGGAGGSTPSGGGGSTSVAALDSVPLEFSFTGSFFHLADFFRQLDRFVRMANGRLVVHGRLMTIDKFTLSSGESFPKLTASVNATVYLVPRAEGTAAGATPAGPSSTPASASLPASGSPQGTKTSSNSSLPTASATP
jgi:hypothetical protein